MMVDSLSRLSDELWGLLVADGGQSIRDLLSLKKREDRRGRMKRLFNRAIRSSSLGVFAGKIHYFSGKLYESISANVLMNVLYEIMANRVELPDADLVKLSDIYTDCLNTVYSKPLFVSNHIMVFRNGVLDVERGVFSKKFDKKFVQMWSVDYDYTPGMSTFLWHQFIHQVLPEERWRDALQMFLGATFIDRQKVNVEHILILFGKTGSNGKSVVHNVVCGVLGYDCVSTHDIGRLCKSGLEGDNAVADINGKRLNYCTEMSEADFYRKSARLKALISGESVTACRKHENPFKAANIPLLMANANVIPAFSSSDTALMRRIYVIPFQVTIPPEKQNRTLGDELVAEYPGILNWILEGRKKFIENGYRLPQDISLDKYIDEDKVEFSTILKFMSKHSYKPRVEGVDVAPMVWVRCSELYNDYVRWCKQNSVDYVGKTVFTHVLVNDCGYRRERKNLGYCYAVFGTHLEKLKKVRQESNGRKLDMSKSELLWVNGVGYATNLAMLARFTGVSKHTLRTLKTEGRFLEHTRANGRYDVYDVKGCTEVLRELHVIATDDERSTLTRLRSDLNYKRTLFNIRMKKRGWPYRQYDNDKPQLEEGIIVVPDYTTDAEVLVMAREAGYDISKYRGEYGAYSRGGIGTQKSADDIPTAKEIRKYKKNML